MQALAAGDNALKDGIVFLAFAMELSFPSKGVGTVPKNCALKEVYSGY